MSSDNFLFVCLFVLDVISYYLEWELQFSLKYDKDAEKELIC